MSSWFRKIGSARMFDSLYTSIDSLTLELISNLYGSNVVMVEEGPKQIGVKDCGLFAIATAILLANGGNPKTCAFNQRAMRGHLIECFELELSLFPQY